MSSSGAPTPEPPDSGPIVVEYVNTDGRRCSSSTSTAIDEQSKSYKSIGLLLLTIQQASMPLMVRYSRTRTDRTIFLTTSSVFMMEVIKLSFCSAVLIAQEESVLKFLKQCKAAILDDPLETLKVCVPALIYTLQNNLYYVALTHLEATTFCVTYQLKIFTTALFLVLLLKRQLSSVQWASLAMLAVGVAAVQLQQQTDANVEKPMAADQRPLIGLFAALAMCFTSGFAGVYFEKVLKASSVSVWMQNIRLALLGLPMSAIIMYYKDYDTISEDGVFQGWDWLVWLITTNNSIGGLLIAMVMKYADNILKTYAQSMAIVGAAVGSAFWFDFAPNELFLVGTALVLASMYLYNKHPAKAVAGRNNGWSVKTGRPIEVLLHNPARPSNNKPIMGTASGGHLFTST